MPPAPPDDGSARRDDSWVARIAARIVALAADRLGAPPDEATRRLEGDLVGLLRTEVLERVDRNERLASVGERSASVVHDLRNPLSVIETSAFVIAERAGSDARIAQHARRIAAQAALAAEIVTDLLDTAGGRAVEPARLEIAALVTRSIAQFSPEIAARIIVEPGTASAHALGDARRLQRVVFNLVQNAFDAMGDTGTVTLSITSDRSTVAIAVRDQGPGIPDAVLPRLFEPLFTTKPTGTGLGLSLSRRIARESGGDLTASSLPGGGATFVLTLPAAADNHGASP